MAEACGDAGHLQAAYQSVVTKYKLKRINFDIESAAATNKAGLDRQVRAAAALLKANPGLSISLTLAADTDGFDSDAYAVLKRFHDGQVPLSSIGLMAFDYGDAVPSETDRITKSAEGAVGQIKQLYGVPATEAWKALNLILMIGRNDTPETLTLADAKTVHGFAAKNRIGTVSIWSVNRDQPCPDGNTGSGPARDNCSGMNQTPYEFSKTLSVPAH